MKWHRFAQKHDFKSVWVIAAGKVVKQKIRACEIKMKKRFPTAWGCFLDLPILGKQHQKKQSTQGQRNLQ
jgi:hypothetical protein